MIVVAAAALAAAVLGWAVIDGLRPVQTQAVGSIEIKADAPAAPQGRPAPPPARAEAQPVGPTPPPAGTVLRPVEATDETENAGDDDSDGDDDGD